MEFKISLMTAEQYDVVSALWKHIEGIGLSSADSEESISSFLKKNPGLSFVACESARIVGTILCGQDGRRGYIYHLAVHPDFRRRGLGRKLVQRCLDALQEAGINKCHLFVFQNNLTGMAFWKSVGWESRHDISAMSFAIP